jgi:DNA modification methylase
MADLFSKQRQASGPVECLGQTFPSDEARREHYLKLLADKLKDPAFRKIEGYPLGSDEQILALSDPPYYTACPNPFIEDFVRHYGKPYDSSVPYNKEPYAADVSEGKNDPIYNAHSYHTKVPHKAIMRYILHYTQPGDLIYDGFCGTGMTGVAAQMCGDRSVVESMGFKVDESGDVLESVIEDGRTVWKTFSKIGVRRAILNDLAPAATFIASNYNLPVEVRLFEDTARNVIRQLKNNVGWMWEVNGKYGRGKINYTVWSELYACGECGGEIVYYENAFKAVGTSVEYKDEFACPHCGVKCSKSPGKDSGATKLERTWSSYHDKYLNQIVKVQKRIPLLINYSIGTKRYEKKIESNDLDVIAKISRLPSQNNIPLEMMPEGDKTWEPIRTGVTHTHHFYSDRVIQTISEFLRLSSDGFASQMQFLLGSALPKLTIMNRYMPQHGGRALVGPMANTLYIPPVNVENNVIDQIEYQLKKIIQAIGARANNSALISTQAIQSLDIQDNSLDYIFIDPPFGANIMYSELSFLRESWLSVKTNSKPEAIENNTQGKTIDSYRTLMTQSFREAYRALKPGRWMTVEFSNTKASVWNSIQTALSDCGFVVASVAALDKTRGGLHSMLGVTAVKQDLVISAYKPTSELQTRFEQIGGSEESVWDFVRTHLSYLPKVKIRDKQLEFIAERDPRIIFDRMVGWFVRHNVPVPMSSQEFQAGLTQRFFVRDGMTFLPDQVAEYDKKRMQVAIAPQMEMFISDERSAIDWLSDFLKRRPSTYQEIHTDFISQLGAGWKKHESKPELAALLEDNFIQYDGTGEVPSQIHGYLSTNHKDFRGLEKSSPALVAKAKDRWYVPDPNKAQDLEKKREKALLKEFGEYQTSTGRKLKEFRLEALRAGFKAAWGAKNYKAIIAIAQKIPEEALQEDEKLLLWYDQALTRMEAGA